MKLQLLQLNLRGNKIGKDGGLAVVSAMQRSNCPLNLLDLSDTGMCGFTRHC